MAKTSMPNSRKATTNSMAIPPKGNSRTVVLLRVMALQSERTALVLLKLGVSSMDRRVDSMAPTTLAIPKVTPGTSKSSHLEQWSQWKVLTSSCSGGQDTRGYDQSYQSQAPYDSNLAQQQSGQVDPNAPYDPNAPVDPNAPESDRGLGSTLVGGVVGHHLGKKQGHGFLGSVGGAIVANFVEGKFKDHKKQGSSWGGGRY